MLKVYRHNIHLRNLYTMDVTIKSGVSWLAPTWELVMGYKNGSITKEEYIRRYVEILDKSVENFPDKWARLLQKEIVILTCYCPNHAEFCHTEVLGKYLERFGAKYEGLWEYTDWR